MSPPSSTPRRRGRPRTYENPTERERLKKRRQRAGKKAEREEHPDRVVSDQGLLWFEVWVSVDTTTLEGQRVHSEGYRRFGEAPSKTPYGLVARLPKEYRGRAEKVLEAEGRLPKRTLDMRPRSPGKIIGPHLASGAEPTKQELAVVAHRAPDYADLTVTERVAEINDKTGASNKKGEGAGQSTYEPLRTEAATVSDAAHVLRVHGTELAVGPTASDTEKATFEAWWAGYLRPYGGGVDIPAKIVRVPEEQAVEAKQRLTRFLKQYPSQASCPTCGTSPLAFHEPTLTVGCPECNSICYVSMPRGTMYVGKKRVLSPEEEMEAAWETREDK